MKKFLLSLAMGMTAIGASAQHTYNVRAGGAVLEDMVSLQPWHKQIYHLIITEHGHFANPTNSVRK